MQIRRRILAPNKELFLNTSMQVMKDHKISIEVLDNMISPEVYDTYDQKILKNPRITHTRHACVLKLIYTFHSKAACMMLGLIYILRVYNKN